MINSLEENKISLLEILVKTSYHTQITHPTNKECDDPVAYGSGFIVGYNNESFFVTADHTVHIDDYTESNNERTWTDYVVSIFNNVRPEENFLSTVVTPLGGFYYGEKFNLEKPKDAPELVDISVCKMKSIHFQYPFLTDEVRFQSETINAGEPKLNIREECFSEPQVDKQYFIFGKIRTKMEGIRLHRLSTLKSNLKFIAKSGDYYLFNTPEIISDKEDWEGLSGSPVICENGDCIGVLCSVNENSNSIWIMPIHQVKMLIEIAINQEKLETN